MMGTQPPPTLTVPSVLFLNRSYYPDAEATGQLLTELCEDLANEFSVSVIAGQPNSNPSGASFRRYGSQVVNGVTVRRVWHTRLPKQSWFGRVCNLISFTISATLAGLVGPRPDVVVTETDPPLLCLVGWLLAARFRCRFVAYLQDIHPELGLALGKMRRRAGTVLLRGLFHKAYRRADRVVVLSDDMRRYLRRTGIPASDIQVIHNWVDTQRIVPVKHYNSLRREWNIGDDQFLVMYSGNLGVCQDLSTILDAAGLLAGKRVAKQSPLPQIVCTDTCSGNGDLTANNLGERPGEGAEHELDNATCSEARTPTIQFLLIGNGVSKQPLINGVARRGLSNVRFADYQPLSRLHESLSAADLHLVPVAPRAIHFLMPSKLYGILASGTPLIAIAPKNSELATLVEQEHVGIASPPGDPQALANQILWFSQSCPNLSAYSHRARELAVARFDRSHSVAQFATLLHSLTTDNDETSAESIPKESNYELTKCER